MKKLLCFILMLGIIISSISVEREKKPSISSNYITYNLGTKPKDLIMTSNTNIRDKDLLVALFQGLVAEDIDGKIMPALAKDYKISEDGLEYTFILRDNIKYSNGENITAKDFVGFFKSFLEDKNNIYVSQLYCVFGVKDFVEGKTDFTNVAISEKDEKTLTIRLNYSSPYFIRILSEPVFALRDYKELAANSFSNRNIRYTGPFYIQKQEDSDALILVKNINYYNYSEITSEAIRVTFIDDEEKALTYFEVNDEDDIDIMIESPINEYLRLSQEGKVKGFSSGTVYYLNFNIKSKNLIGDINFRRALNSVISKEYYAQQISKDFAQPASLYVPQGNSDKKSFDTFGNKEEAIKYLEKTAFTGAEIINLIYQEDSVNKRVAEDLVKNISQDLEINIVSKGYDKEVLEGLLEKGDYDIYLSKFTPEFNDLSLYYELWSSKAEGNKIKYSNEEYDALIKSAKYEMDEIKRYSFYTGCEEILKNDLPSIPIYHVNTQICIKPNIYGVYATTLGNIRLDYLSREN